MIGWWLLGGLTALVAAMAGVYYGTRGAARGRRRR